MLNHKSINICLLVCLVLASGSGTYAAHWKFGMLVLAADGSGDYGPQTLGTTTCGWQEAINYCKTHQRELYVKSGAYNVSDTIYVPPIQYFKMDGGEYTVNWVGPPNKDMLVFDSTLDDRLLLGNFAYNGNGAAVSFKPTTLLPLDGQPPPVGGNVPPVWGDSEVRIESIVCSNAGSPSVRQGTGLHFDTTGGAIDSTDFYVGSIRNFGTGISTVATGPSFSFVRVRCADLRTNATSGALLVLGGNQNTFELTMGVDQGATGVIGADIFGKNNVLDLVVKSGFEPGKALVFESPAFGNQANLVTASDVTDPLSLVTNNAGSAVNQITWAGAQSPVRTVSTATGTFTYTQQLCPATVKVVGGTVSSVQMLRGGFTANYSAAPGPILLGVGDQLRITSSAAPSLQVVPLKTK